MKMKKGFLSAAILASFLLSVLVISGAFAAKDEVVLKAPNGDVKFFHKKHAETRKIDCLECHHTWKKGETSGKLCQECHKAKAEGKTLAVKDAYHKNCQDCHKKDKEAKKAAGPTTCTGCHVKAK